METETCVPTKWHDPSDPSLRSCGDASSAAFNATCAHTENSEGNFSKEETCIVFDWDDTLFPSSFIERKRLIHTTGHISDLPVEMQRGFQQLENRISGLLSLACDFGTVLIITNAQKGWVELVVSKFMPGMLKLLDSIRVVSARSSFERLFPGDPLCWKAAAFAHELHLIQREEGTALRNILSFGDSQEERTAVKIAAGQLQSKAKSVKFVDTPSPKQLHQQMEVVHKCLEWICRYHGDLDVVLTIDVSGSRLDGTGSTATVKS